MLDQKSKGRARVRLAVFFVLSIHVIGLMALLMQGCRKPAEPEQPAVDTNAPVPPSMEATNPPVAPTNAAVPAPVVTETAPPAAPTDYTVAKGDTFSSIAKKFSVTTKAIEQANPGAEPTKLQIGQKLHMPAPASAVAPSSTTPPGAIEMGSSGEQTYTVKSGDTLTKIAGEFGVTIKAIRSENNLTTDKIIVGQKLKIPTKTSAPAPAAPAAPAATSPTA
jgi:membrane-bound lytic murein transglycosylase D